MYKFCFFVPDTHLEIVKNAVFATGAGRHGDYDQCCWQTSGQGQFRPLAGSTPYLGQQHQLENVKEHKVELLCRDELITEAISALRSSHPYEEPAFEYWPVKIN